MHAYAAILEALIRRGRTGEGAALKVSLFDGMADWMAVPLLHHDYGGKGPERVGLAHPSIAPYGTFATVDGRLVAIAIQNEREWARLCADVLGAPALATRPGFDSNVARVNNRAAVDGAVAAVIGALTLDAAVAKLRAADIAYGAVNSVADFSRHPQLRRVTIATPGGDVAIPAPPARGLRDDDDDERLGAVPAIGQHGDAIRREFAA